MQWSQLRSVFFTCFNEGTHRKTAASQIDGARRARARAARAAAR
eukprot:COSAG01_NODE_13132_length_1630_cov_27.598955_3_plen_43_part_01